MTNICPQFTLEILCTKVLLAFKAQINAFSSFPFIFCGKLQLSSIEQNTDKKLVDDTAIFLSGGNFLSKLDDD